MSSSVREGLKNLPSPHVSNISSFYLIVAEEGMGVIGWEAQVVRRQSPMRKSLSSRGVQGGSIPPPAERAFPSFHPGQGSAIPREGRGEGCFRGGLLKGCAVRGCTFPPPLSQFCKPPPPHVSYLPVGF